MRTPKLANLRWLDSLRGLDVASAWCPRGLERLELWLPREWPVQDAELRWRRTGPGGEVREGSQKGLEGLAPAIGAVSGLSVETGSATSISTPRAMGSPPSASNSSRDLSFSTRPSGSFAAQSSPIRRQA